MRSIPAALPLLTATAGVAMGCRAAAAAAALALAAAAGGAAAGRAAAPKPHIFMVIVDDFGWADAGWHRGDGGGLPVTKEVVTPTMDQLVKEGIELNRHYVRPTPA